MSGLGNYQAGQQSGSFLVMNLLQTNGWLIRNTTGHLLKLLPSPALQQCFKRSERWPVLPAYTVDGFIVREIVHGSFNAELLQEFIENKVLPHCNPYPCPRSIIVMDYAPIHSQEVSVHIFHKTISSKQY
jgi:hypothetical protein